MLLSMAYEVHLTIQPHPCRHLVLGSRSLIQMLQGVLHQEKVQ